MSRFSVEIFLSHSVEKFRKGTLLCFTKFLVAKKFMDEGEGGGRNYQKFPSSIFCLSAENFVKETSSFSLISGKEKC